MLEGARKGQQAWSWAALALAVAVLALLVLDTAWWHPGYAHGDETDIIARVQRVREGMPLGWDLSQGSIHRLLLWGSMALWPGKLWATSVPAMLGFCAEMALLFAVGKRLAGPRAGALAVFFGALSAFTLVRARVALSLSLFPAEWLFLVWLRPYAKKPWQWLCWGAALGLCCFDYEAWLPNAVLLLALPFMGSVGLRQRAWELAGLLALLACLLPPSQFLHYVERRHAASLSNVGSPSPGWPGLKDLVLGGHTLPYMAPPDHGVLPLWLWLLLPLGLWTWGSQAWVPLAYLSLGVVLPLMGGAPYGLPAHRAIAAWPLWVLIAGLGVERLWAMSGGLPRALLMLGLAGIGASQLYAWQDSQGRFDQDFRGRTRELQAAAVTAWQHSQSTGLPLVTELHPMAGAQFRFLTGHTVPLPDAAATSIVAFVTWDYFPAIKDQKAPLATFQEAPGIPPVLVVVLNGSVARQAVEAERAYRPLLLRYPQYSLASSDLVFDWIRQHPQAGPWARTLALDYVGKAAWANVRLSSEWVEDVWAAKLLSARPLLTAADSLARKQPALALSYARRAREMEPNDRRAWEIEGGLLQRLGLSAQLQQMEKARDSYEQHSLLFQD